MHTWSVFLLSFLFPSFLISIIFLSSFFFRLVFLAPPPTFLCPLQPSSYAYDHFFSPICLPVPFQPQGCRTDFALAKSTQPRRKVGTELAVPITCRATVAQKGASFLIGTKVLTEMATLFFVVFSPFWVFLFYSIGSIWSGGQNMGNGVRPLF